ncbi:MAG: sulfatase-like hydrolase/transferase [Pirellulaceae bacterium]
MRTTLVLTIRGSLAAMLLMALPAVAAARPNILVIVGDDMGYADIGPHGCQDIPTPNFDALAKNGTRCTSGYVSGPYCSPTRAGLMTGRYQQRFGHEFNPGPTPAGDIGLPLTETTLADRLQAAGYATGMVGKWHLGTGEKFHPQSRGFQEFFGFLGGARSYFPLDGGNAGGVMLRGRERVEEKEPYTTDTFTREATRFIDKHAGEPWFLYLPYNAVHGPMHATEKYLARFPNIQDEKRKTYAAMMSAMDDGIGAVLGKLDEKKLTENTLIFFISDNGGPTQVNGSSNKPLRGDKAQTWEGGIRVPYLVQWKGRIPGGKTFDQPVIQLDIHPTALAAAGVETAGAMLDGVNLLPHLEGIATKPPHDALFWRFGDQMAIRHGNYKLVQERGAQRPLLFDLAADIGETKDLSADKPEVVKDLTAQYDEWNKTLEDPRWGQRNRALGGGKKAKRAKAKAKRND